MGDVDVDVDGKLIKSGMVVHERRRKYNFLIEV